MKKLFNHIIIIVFSIILFCFVMIMIISSFFSRDMMERNFKNIDIIHEIKKIQNSTNSGTSAEVEDLINMAYSEAEDHGIKKKLVNTIFNDDETKKFLGTLVGTTTDYVVNGNRGTIPTSDDFNKLLDNNIDRWIKESGLTISDTKKEVLLIRMKSMASGIIDNMPNYTSVKGSIGDDTLRLIHFIFSDTLKMVLGFLCFVFTIIIYIVNRRDYACFKYLGGTMLLSSVMLFVVSFTLEDVLAYVLSGYNLTSLINSFVNLMSIRVIMIAVIFLIFGILFEFIYNKRIKRIKK